MLTPDGRRTDPTRVPNDPPPPGSYTVQVPFDSTLMLYSRSSSMPPLLERWTKSLLGISGFLVTTHRLVTPSVNARLSNSPLRLPEGLPVEGLLGFFGGPERGGSGRPSVSPRASDASSHTP